MIKTRLLSICVSIVIIYCGVTLNRLREISRKKKKEKLYPAQKRGKIVYKYALEPLCHCARDKYYYNAPIVSNFVLNR